ncbi:MAG TPA: AI-2E family transporter [Rhizomicrobium sp.]|nr:AI-2E family transporter [Rhizomicrobium sp.]
MEIEHAKRLYRFGFVLILTIAACAVFFFLIHNFAVDIFLAAIFAGLLRPLFRRLSRLLGGREGFATALIVIIGLFAVVFPLAAVMTMVVSEAVQVSGSVVGWIQNGIARPESLVEMLPRKLVESKEFSEATAWFSSHAADAIGALSNYLSSSVSLVLRGVGRLFLDLFVISFAMAYFLRHGGALIARLEERIPLAKPEAQAIVDKTLRITAATLRGVIIGGAVDGALIGIGFALAKIGQPLFWGTVAVVASQTPVLGCAVVWIPAAAYLMLTGQMMAGIEIALWGTLINAVVDNFLRAYIVGRGGAIPAFLALVSTLGGIAVFGASGILIGPVLTGVTIGILDLYEQSLKSSGLMRSP